MPTHYHPLRRAPGWTTLALALVATCAAARPRITPPEQQSRLESPHTDAPVQPDSLFAPVVAATPAVRVLAQRGGRAAGGLPNDTATISLDGTWKFQLESTECTDDPSCEGIEQRWFAPEYDDAAWRDLAVPGHFTRQIPTDELGGRASALPFHFAWYRRRFTLPATLDLARQHLRLLFEAVDYRADVWLDGVQPSAASHLGTFNPFAFSLPASITAGPHVLAVRVQKPLQHSILACGDGAGPGTDLKTVIDGTKGYWDGRPGGNDDIFDAVTKQSLHTGGIVRPVSVRATGAVRLDWVFVTAQPARHGRADVLLAYAPLLVTSEVPTPVLRPGETVHLPIWIVNDDERPVGRVALSYVTGCCVSRSAAAGGCWPRTSTCSPSPTPPGARRPGCRTASRRTGRSRASARCASPSRCARRRPERR